MTASRSARQRKAVAEAGPLATVRINVNGQQQFVFFYKIGCSVCVVKDRAAWSAYRPGGDNGFMAAMDRWIFHLTEKHPGADAPVPGLPACRPATPARAPRAAGCRPAGVGVPLVSVSPAGR